MGRRALPLRDRRGLYQAGDPGSADGGARHESRLWSGDAPLLLGQWRLKKRPVVNGPLPETLSAIPDGSISQEVLQAAIYRFADSVIAGDGRFAAVKALLCRTRPTIAGHPEGAPTSPNSGNLLESMIKVVANLCDSYLFIQGPPGTGKTYVASHVIVALLQMGKKVGVSSNSHKAINNLLAVVEQVAQAQGFRFHGQKKSTANQPETFFNGDLIEDVT